MRVEGYLALLALVAAGALAVVWLREIALSRRHRNAR